MKLFEKKKFQGSWESRLTGLFDAGVSFQGKTILDIGCNMGIVGYEVCKRGPTLYHGVETLTPHARIAASIFTAVNVENAIFNIDITDPAQREDHLLPRYDVVLYLAVHHHLINNSGPEIAAATGRDLLARCGEALIYRGDNMNEFMALAEAEGFEAGPIFDGGARKPLRTFWRK